MILSALFGLLIFVGIAAALTFRKTRLIGLALFMISVVVIVVGAHPWF